MDGAKNKKIEHFMRVSALLDRSFFIAFLLVCVGVMALCVSLYINARTNAYQAYLRSAQCSTMSLSTLLESYVSRMFETQRSFIEKDGAGIGGDGMSERLQLLSGTLAPDGVRAAMFLSMEGKVSNASPRNTLAGQERLLAPYLQRMAGNPKSIISTPPFNVGGNMVICLMSPVFENEGDGLSGILCYVIDIDAVAKRIFHDIALGDSEYAWIFDQGMSVVYEQGSLPKMGSGLSLDRRRFMSSALARRCGHDSYTRELGDGRVEEYLVYYTSVHLDSLSHWVICVEAPADAVKMASEGFPIAYAVPLVIFFFMIVMLSLLKRYFGNRYVTILEGAITASRDARKEIESRLLAIMESFPYIIFETDCGGNFTFLNFAREQMGGISSEAFECRSLIELVDSSETFSFKDAFARMVNDGNRLSHLRVSMCLDGVSGSVMSVNASPIYDDNKEIVGSRGVMHDITERVELEMHLIQSQKMDSIGMVASGIAHDFNNYISTILGYVSMIKMKGSPSEEMDALEKAAKNAARLTGQLMQFSRANDENERASCTTPNETIETMAGILKKSLPHTIKLNVDIEDSLPSLKVSQTHIEQILMNLVINARDAMPDGGDIAVRCWSTVVNEIYSRQLDIQPGNYVILDVSDTGPGLSDEIKGRIFEPYFTTKKTGTGLGLATVYAILKKAGGSILVKSGKKGAQFFLYIPQAWQGQRGG